MPARPLEFDTIPVGAPRPNGRTVLVPRYGRVRSRHRLDGTAKIAFKMHSDARKASRKHQDVYRCRFCGAWHLATKRKRAEPHVRPVVRIRTMANAA